MSRIIPINFPIHFLALANGVVTFIPGVYEQFQPSTGQDAILTITSDDPLVGTAEPSAGLLLLTGFLGFVTLRTFSRECKLWRW
jgi:hypothetical protein